jgi:hypothetical protein
VNTTATNNANITGIAPVSQTAVAITNPQAFAQAGPNNTLGTLVQLRGKNKLNFDIDNEGTGGDAIAGSNVIGVAGAGNTTINANNNSEFSRSQGGEVNFDNVQTGNNGPREDVQGGRVTVTSIATGIATVNQTATPNITVNLLQNANADGATNVTNAALGLATGTATQNAGGVAVVNSTATSPVSGTATATLSATGVGPLTQAITQNFSSAVNNTVTPTTSVLGTNAALITTDASVTQSAFTQTNPVSVAVAP